MAGNNTEQPANKAEQKKNVPAVNPKKTAVENAPVKKEEKKTTEDKTTEVNETPKKEEKKIEVKKVKKNSVNVNVTNVKTSTKVSVSICKFIKNKTIENAIKDLESVSLLKKAVPMKGEIPHRRGKIMSGRFPVRASKEFIILLKSLKGNAINHDLESPIISEAIANKGTTTYAKGGRARAKRTNVKITATSKKENKK
jgi:large subunit ribosomal protein L22